MHVQSNQLTKQSYSGTIQGSFLEQPTVEQNLMCLQSNTHNFQLFHHCQTRVSMNTEYRISKQKLTFIDRSSSH
jgi:hypothetical protein